MTTGRFAGNRMFIKLMAFPFEIIWERWNTISKTYHYWRFFSALRPTPTEKINKLALYSSQLIFTRIAHPILYVIGYIYQCFYFLKHPFCFTAQVMWEEGEWMPRNTDRCWRSISKNRTKSPATQAMMMD